MMEMVSEYGIYSPDLLNRITETSQPHFFQASVIELRRNQPMRLVKGCVSESLLLLLFAWGLLSMEVGLP